MTRAPGKPEGDCRRPAEQAVLQVRGVVDPEIAAGVHGMKLVPGGEWFSRRRRPPVESFRSVAGGSGGRLGRRRVSRIGPRAELRRNAKDPNRVVAGDTFPVGDKTWYVAGVMEATNTAFDSEVWAKQSYIGPLFGK